MNIIAYTYEADTHCIACTKQRFSDEQNTSIKFTNFIDEHGIWDDPQFPTIDNEGNQIHPIFSIDEWQELHESLLQELCCTYSRSLCSAENPTQYLACGNCHDVIDEYTHDVV